jgi:hypothetical protein
MLRVVAGMEVDELAEIARLTMRESDCVEGSSLRDFATERWTHWLEGKAFQER